MAMSATTKANIGAGRKAGLRLNSKGLGTSPFSQAKSAASKSVRKVNSEVKSKIAKAKKKGIAGKPSSPKINKENLDPTPSPDSFSVSKAKAMVEGTQRSKNRLRRHFFRNLEIITFGRRHTEQTKRKISNTLKKRSLERSMQRGGFAASGLSILSNSLAATPTLLTSTTLAPAIVAGVAIPTAAAVSYQLGKGIGASIWQRRRSTDVSNRYQYVYSTRHKKVGLSGPYYYES